jgi:putative DNA methylase
MSRDKRSKESRPLIELDSFPFDFLSDLAETESWRKEIYRPIYHLHKWWATRLGSVFRGILLACQKSDSVDFDKEFYRPHHFAGKIVFDPFMGSGTTVGEAHKLGYTALGRDINPVAANAARVAMGSLDKAAITRAFDEVKGQAADRIMALYKGKDTSGIECDVLYYFWVKTVNCPACLRKVDLFSSYIIARDADPVRNPAVQVLCPGCGSLFPSRYTTTTENCPRCNERFNPQQGPAHNANAICSYCDFKFPIAKTIRASGKPPDHRLFAKLLLRPSGQKVYLAATDDDNTAYHRASEQLRTERFSLPELEIADGYNTRQVLNYGYRSWREFFNDRQLVALGILHQAIAAIKDERARVPLLTLFSATLEFNNMFASYKGEGTGAVRHMFSHHILKPERTPVEANVWGTERSSGAFSTLFKTRLLRCIEYQQNPFEVSSPSLRSKSSASKVFGCSLPFAGRLQPGWPNSNVLPQDSIFLSCGSSHRTGLASCSVDYVVTDPPFFDNVHYSELADFFYAWQKLCPTQAETPFQSTRHQHEVQDTKATCFTAKLTAVFRECHRVLRDEGILVFTYHHSRHDGWLSLCDACMNAGFHFVNAHPVKSEMSVATPKSQAKEPIDIDMILVCRKTCSDERDFRDERTAWHRALQRARHKGEKYLQNPRRFSRNDMKVLLISHLLVELCAGRTASEVLSHLSAVIHRIDARARYLFDRLLLSSQPRAKTLLPCRHHQMELFK